MCILFTNSMFKILYFFFISIIYSFIFLWWYQIYISATCIASWVFHFFLFRLSYMNRLCELAWHSDRLEAAGNSRVSGMQRGNLCKLISNPVISLLISRRRNHLSAYHFCLIDYHDNYSLFLWVLGYSYAMKKFLVTDSCYKDGVLVSTCGALLSMLLQERIKNTKNNEIISIEDTWQPSS